LPLSGRQEALATTPADDHEFRWGGEQRLEVGLAELGGVLWPQESDLAECIEADRRTQALFTDADLAVGVAADEECRARRRNIKGHASVP